MHSCSPPSHAGQPLAQTWWGSSPGPRQRPVCGVCDVWVCVWVCGGGGGVEQYI